MISKEAEKLLKSYSWPGNIRELRNDVSRIVRRANAGERLIVTNNPFQNPQLQYDVNASGQSPRASYASSR